MGTAYLFGSEDKDSQKINSTEATRKINDLLSLNVNSRNDDWAREFLHYSPYGYFSIAEGTEVSLHSDGFPYLQLMKYLPDNTSEVICINQELDHLLAQGIGVCIKSENQIDWSFSYGDLINLYLHKSFFTVDNIFSKDSQSVQIQTDEKILIGQPSENILPPVLRRQLREYFIYTGIKNPKVMLIAQDYEDEKKVSQNLVFNIFPGQFHKESEFQEVMAAIAWYLPRYYSFLAVDEKTIKNGFENL
ncbi:MAG TPA: hypothetical protein VK102_11710 [Sphingobacterium sp.]|nr:hypothetical protein [Sphingobacterium sp.]